MGWSVIGHRWAVDLLVRSLETNKVSHAYLLVGLPHIGKTTLARGLAQALNCVGASPPCGVCRSCWLVQADKHPDVRVLAPENGHIKIEDIRDLQRMAALSPVEGWYRVFVISQVDQATASAANGLLKTLEEPPERVVLLLTASRMESLLPTIVSRCQVLNLRPLSIKEVVATLLSRGVDKARAELLGRLSGGRVGWAIAAADDRDVLERRNAIVEKLIEIEQGSYTTRFSFADQWSKKPDHVSELLWVLGSWWHDVLLLASGSDVPITNTDRALEIERWAARFGVSAAAQTLQAIHQTTWRLEHNANLRLALEVLMLDMPSRHRL